MAKIAFPARMGIILHPTDRAILVKTEICGKLYAERYQLRKISRKRCVKKLMGKGIPRNAAYHIARVYALLHGSYARGMMSAKLNYGHVGYSTRVLLADEFLKGGADE